jgi:nucleoside-diphosphate kinase
MTDHVEQTLFLIKPDGVQRGLTGRIIQRLEDTGFKIAAAKMVWADEDLAKDHYAEHVGKDFYDGLEALLTSGPVMAMIIEGASAIDKTRQLIGDTQPKEAQPGTIRGDFASMDYDLADAHGIGLKNLVHASEDKEAAQEEINIWFDDDEQHNYKTVHEQHTTQ